MSEPTESHDGTVTWWEIQVSDLDAAERFYGEVFGWTFQRPMGDTYGIAVGKGGQLVGGLDATEPQRPVASEGRHVRIYVSVDDMEAALDRVASAGGTVRTKRQLISEEFGYWADFDDPSGITIGVVTNNPPAA